MQGWDRAASCTPCGSGPWLSEQSEALDILDPDTSLTIAVNYTRGSTLSCYTQPGMGVITVNNMLTAVICPVDFYGAATQRNGLLVNPCLQCPTGTVTAGDERAKQYNNAAGDSVAIAEGGYYSVASCVTPPGEICVTNLQSYMFMTVTVQASVFGKQLALLILMQSLLPSSCKHLQPGKLMQQQRHCRCCCAFLC